MGAIGLFVAAIAVVAFFFVGARIFGWFFGGAAKTPVGGAADDDRDWLKRSDSNELDDVGRRPDIWPDRTGAITRHELGARDTKNLTFDKNMEEGPPATAGSREAGTLSGPGAASAARRRTVNEAAGPPGQRDDNTALVDADNPWVKGSPSYTPSMDDKSAHAPTPPDHTTDRVQPIRSGQVRKETSFPDTGGVEGGRGGLAPEDEFGENRPANRVTAPDAPPNQWHPEDHGVPGDHIREGHHRSGTAPERHSSATDPKAHAPIPGPAHVPPPGGWPMESSEQPPTGP